MQLYVQRFACKACVTEMFKTRPERSTEPFLTGADRFLTGIDPARFGSISLLSILTGTKWPCGYSQLSVVSDPQNTGKCRPSDPTYRPKMKLRLNLRASAELGPPVGSLKLRLGIFRNTETVDIKGNRVSGCKHKN